MEMVRSMLANSKLPKSFWAEALAILHGTYLRNQCLTKAAADEKTLFKALTLLSESES